MSKASEINERINKVTTLHKDPFIHHQLKIAHATLKMSDAGASIMGGMTKEEAKALIKKQGGKIKNEE